MFTNYLHDLRTIFVSFCHSSSWIPTCYQLPESECLTLLALTWNSRRMRAAPPVALEETIHTLK